MQTMILTRAHCKGCSDIPTYCPQVTIGSAIATSVVSTTTGFQG